MRAETIVAFFELIPTVCGSAALVYCSIALYKDLKWGDNVKKLPLFYPMLTLMYEKGDDGLNSLKRHPFFQIVVLTFLAPTVVHLVLHIFLTAIQRNEFDADDNLITPEEDPDILIALNLAPGPGNRKSMDPSFSFPHPNSGDDSASNLTVNITNHVSFDSQIPTPNKQQPPPLNHYKNSVLKDPKKDEPPVKPVKKKEAKAPVPVPIPVPGPTPVSPGPATVSSSAKSLEMDRTAGRTAIHQTTNKNDKLKALGDKKWPRPLAQPERQLNRKQSKDLATIVFELLKKRQEKKRKKSKANDNPPLQKPGGGLTQLEPPKKLYHNKLQEESKPLAQTFNKNTFLHKNQNQNHPDGNALEKPREDVHSAFSLASSVTENSVEKLEEGQAEPHPSNLNLNSASASVHSSLNSLVEIEDTLIEDVKLLNPRMCKLLLLATYLFESLIAFSAMYYQNQGYMESMNIEFIEPYFQSRSQRLRISAYLYSSCIDDTYVDKVRNETKQHNNQTGLPNEFKDSLLTNYEALLDLRDSSFMCQDSHSKIGTMVLSFFLGLSGLLATVVVYWQYSESLAFRDGSNYSAYRQYQMRQLKLQLKKQVDGKSGVGKDLKPRMSRFSEAESVDEKVLRMRYRTDRIDSAASAEEKTFQPFNNGQNQTFEIGGL